MKYFNFACFYFFNLFYIMVLIHSSNSLALKNSNKNSIKTTDDQNLCQLYTASDINQLVNDSKNESKQHIDKYYFLFFTSKIFIIKYY